MRHHYRRLETPHACAAERPVRFADVIEEVSKLAASPVEAAQVIDRMLRRGAIRFVRDFDPHRLAI